MSEPTARMIERAARALCAHAGYDPDGLEPGNVIIHPLDNLETWESVEGVFIDTLADNGTRPPDGYSGKDPCHFMWRRYIEEAQIALRAALLIGENPNAPNEPIGILEFTESALKSLREFKRIS